MILNSKDFKVLYLADIICRQINGISKYFSVTEINLDNMYYS